MHRNIDITVTPDATDGLLSELGRVEGVISLVVHREASVKPPGDVIQASVLNRAADAVLQIVEQRSADGPMSISTSELDSLVDPDQSALIRSDVDEATWEDAETAMRRHTRPTLNFAVTTAAGGIVAACALMAPSEATEATALVAAAIIAPAVEPLARIALAIVLRRWNVLLESLRSAALCYAILVVVAIGTMLVLHAGSPDFTRDFLRSSTVMEVRHPPAVDLIVSACGAVAAVIMIAAGRFTVLAGPLVALQMLPAAATIGVGVELGDGNVAAQGVERLAIDMGMVLVAGLIVFAYKQATVHSGRRTFR